ncbi:TolC family protein [uncultured Bacteroides sp.]|uniref:TolC family protein n=1 Tax=uncultured Bacteroides sp. TaxID=162156 RepID=UPI002AA91A24|nr:TolC family protein [uncultured Bacteroides sp.]
MPATVMPERELIEQHIMRIISTYYKNKQSKLTTEMEMKRILATVLIMLGILPAFAQDSIKYISLHQACKLGIVSNAGIINAKLETKKSGYQLKETQSKLYPQLEGYSDFSYYYAIPQMMMPGEMFGQTGEVPVQIGTKYDWTYGFKASVTLYNQSYYTSIKVAKRMQTINELTALQKKEELVYEVSQVYFLCKTTANQITQLEKNKQNTDRLLDILKLQEENGIARKIDYSKVWVTKNNLQTQIDNLDQLLQQQTGLLKHLIGIKLDDRIELSDSLSFTTGLPDFEKPDFNRQSELRLLDKQIELTGLNRKANRQAYLPSLSGSGQLYYDGQQNEFDYFKGGGDKFYKVGFIGLSLSIPIFDGFEKRSKTKQYDIELQQLQNTRKDTENNYLKDFIDAKNQYNTSLKALLRQLDNIKVAEEDYNITLQNYRQQVMSLSDVMLSENSLTEARLSYVNALLQVKNAELDLKKGQGELLNY